MNNKFKNTYIKTGHLSVDELNALAKKYSEASGYPLERMQEGGGRCNAPFDFIASVSDGQDPSDPYDCITVVYSLSNLELPESELTEITEADLDEHLNSTAKEPTVLFPDNLKTFSLSDLDGKSGVIRVGTDLSNGKDKSIRMVSFHSDDGNTYVISVEECKC